MTEENTTKEIEVVPGNNPYGTDRLVAKIGNGRGATVKYEIFAFCPQISEERTCEEVEASLMEQYGEKFDLNECIRVAVRALTTRPNFSTCFSASGDFDHEKAQSMMDSYQVGARTSSGGETQKKLASEMKALKEVAGDMTAEEIMELIKNAQGL